MKKLIIIILVLTVSDGLALANTISVPADQSTIQAGIDAAVNGDTVLVADGEYSGTGNINLDFWSKYIVVMSENGPLACIINCLASGQGFYFHSGETNSAVVDGFTILGGNNNYGGGIRIENSSPTITHCVIRNNYGYYGGGIYMNNASPLIVRCTVANNSATNGGGIYFTNSSPLITTSIISGNASSG